MSVCVSASIDDWGLMIGDLLNIRGLGDCVIRLTIAAFLALGDLGNHDWGNHDSQNRVDSRSRLKGRPIINRHSPDPPIANAPPIEWRNPTIGRSPINRQSPILNHQWT